MNEIVVVATLQGKKEHVAEIEPMLLKLVEATRKEEGCLSYLLYQDSETPETFVFYEKWQSADHLQNHMKTEHFVTTMAALEGKIKQSEIRKLQQLI